MNAHAYKPLFVWKHLNKLRWLVLATVFTMLILIPYLHVYQNFAAAHAYDLLPPADKRVYDVMEALTAPFTSNPEADLDAIKGNTWSGRFWGYQISDPLAVAGHASATLKPYWPFVLTALLPVLLSALFGRFFCGWICPATLLYELNSNLRALLRRAGVRVGNRRFDRRLKYAVLALGAVAAALTGSVVFAAIYPPALIGREIYYAIAFGAFGSGAVFFLLTLLLDVFVARRGFCRYLCPGGALYSLLGRYRPVRIRRVVENCNDCGKCTAVCEFGLDPLRDGFGQECNNCTACIAICPTDAMTFHLSMLDPDYQGPGHLGPRYRRRERQQGAPDAVAEAGHRHASA